MMLGHLSRFEFISRGSHRSNLEDASQVMTDGPHQRSPPKCPPSFDWDFDFLLAPPLASESSQTSSSFVFMSFLLSEGHPLVSGFGFFNLSILAKSFLTNVPSFILFNYSCLLILTPLSQNYFLSFPSYCFTNDHTECDNS